MKPSTPTEAQMGIDSLQAALAIVRFNSIKGVIYSKEEYQKLFDCYRTLAVIIDHTHDPSSDELPL